MRMSHFGTVGEFRESMQLSAEVVRVRNECQDVDIDWKPVARFEGVIGIARGDVNFCRGEHELVWDRGGGLIGEKDADGGFDGFRFPGRLHVNLKDETRALRKTPTHAIGDKGRLFLAAN